METIENVLAQVDGRDLTDAEQAVLARTKERIAELDAQIKPLEDYEAVRDAHHDTPTASSWAATAPSPSPAVSQPSRAAPTAATAPPSMRAPVTTWSTTCGRSGSWSEAAPTPTPPPACTRPG